MKEQIERDPKILSMMDATPAAVFLNPGDVLNEPGLSRTEKRALLADWASDARAVSNAPALRQLAADASIEIDEILDALKRLDEREELPSKLDHSARAQSSSRSKVSPFRRPQQDASRQAGCPQAGCPQADLNDKPDEDPDDDPPPAAALAVPAPSRMLVAA